MSRSVAQLLTRARQLLQDQASEAYRYPTEDLVDALNDGFMETYRLRPDIFIGTFGDELPDIPIDLNDYTEVLYPLPAFTFTALVDFVVGRVAARDDEGQNESRASAFLASFTQKLLGSA